jgi:hypothetical protein
MSKSGIKLEMVNFVLLVVILILVIFCCCCKNNEGFQPTQPQKAVVGGVYGLNSMEEGTKNHAYYSPGGPHVNKVKYPKGKVIHQVGSSGGS